MLFLKSGPLLRDFGLILRVPGALPLSPSLLFPLALGPVLELPYDSGEGVQEDE